jgi:hypothetical protein
MFFACSVLLIQPTMIQHFFRSSADGATCTTSTIDETSPASPPTTQPPAAIISGEVSTNFPALPPAGDG